MNVNKTVTMVVGLVVGVLLIAGVVTPVISNVSSDDGGSGSGGSDAEYTNTGENTFLRTTSSTSVTYYPYAVGQWCVDPESVEDREVYDGRIYFYTDSSSFFARVDQQTEAPPVLSIRIGSTWYSADQISVEGSTLSFIDKNTSNTESISDIRYCTYPDGGSINTVVGSLANFNIQSRYAFNGTPIYCSLYVNDMGCQLIVSGTAKSNTVSLLLEGSIPIESIGPSADIVIADDQISSITVTVNGTEYTCDLEVPASERAMEIQLCILPVTVTDSGSGGDSGLSPTLKTMLSVIPLVLTVGLVIGAIGYLRFRE